jgi:hypothetical protein
MYQLTIQDMHAKVGQAIYTELAKLEVSSVEVGGTGSNDVAAPTEDDVIQICNNVVRTLKTYTTEYSCISRVTHKAMHVSTFCQSKHSCAAIVVQVQLCASMSIM